jgi:predicted NAD-dependent protein-ADP-ribosyltransferase YbiA (DUF1768 family)
LKAYGKQDSSVSLLVVQEQVFIGQGHVLDLLFSLQKTPRNGRFSRFSPFPLIIQGKRQRTREKAHCGRFPTIPDQKDKRKNRLLYMIAEKGIILL